MAIENARKAWVPLFLILAALCVGVFSACGSSDDDSSSAADTGASATEETSGGEDAGEDLLTGLYDGEFVAVPGSIPKAVSGKDVWFISCGEAFENCAKASAAFKEAGNALGWNVTVVDGEANPAKANDLIKQGVAAKVDGIASIAWDCPTIKAGLLAAREADIPTVNFGGFDCDYPEFGGGEPLFTKTVNSLGGASFEDYIEAYETARADAMLALVGDGVKILSLEEQSLTNQRAKAKAFNSRVEEQCPDCEIVSVDWQFSQVPAAATQIWKSAIQSNPDATVLANATDDIMNLGLRSAIQQSGRRDLFVMGGEGPPANIKLIREGLQSAALAIPPGYAWQMWGEADTLNRIFAGEKQFPDEGGGWVLIDQDHLPAEGDEVEFPDFRGEFTKAWEG